MTGAADNVNTISGIDQRHRDMLLGMTHEEVAADLARKEIHSYRQLPLMVYQIELYLAF